MANPLHLAMLKKGVDSWNQWRKQKPKVQPDLSEAELHQAQLFGANLRETNFSRADVSEADLRRADLTGANLAEANLEEAAFHGATLCRANLEHVEAFAVLFFHANLCQANLRRAFLEATDFTEANLKAADLSDTDLRDANLTGADLRMADLSKADLRQADLSKANFRGADLSEANLGQATLVRTNLERANLTACSVYGVSAWDVRLAGAIQSNLLITAAGTPPIQVDNLEVAQFIYLMLNNQKIRAVIDTITSKVVLILGRFTPDRRIVLDAIREELRKRGYLPVLFDFKRPASKDLTGTISTLANMARFIIADLTDPNSVPHELATVVPSTVVPVQAIILTGRRAYPMFDDLKRRYHWVLNPYRYKSKKILIDQLVTQVIAPAESKARELMKKQS